MKDGQEFIMRLTLDNETMTANVERVGEIIRCKDCKFADVYYHGFQSTDMFTRVCKKLVRHVETDGFCSWAERK